MLIRNTHYVKACFNKLMVWEAQTLRESANCLYGHCCWARTTRWTFFVCHPDQSWQCIHGLHMEQDGVEAHTSLTALEIPYWPLSPTSQTDSLSLSRFTYIYEFCSYSMASSILNNVLTSSPGLFCLCWVPVCMFDITEKLLVLHLCFCLSSCIRCCLSEFSFTKTLQPTLSLGPHSPSLHTDLTGMLNLYTLTWTNSLFSFLFLDLHFCFIPNPWKSLLFIFMLTRPLK